METFQFQQTYIKFRFYVLFFQPKYKQPNRINLGHKYTYTGIYDIVVSN